ncbi:hypothetical protein LCGC14_1934250 [marine sediment metagenome]|uniref:Uncharacterized protein n=1 Tax=marine sediment metagenome TaxID=412755 RepID=A0A0F9IJQ1_9ZZZZ
MDETFVEARDEADRTLVAVDLPQYQCHKVVRAAKITGLSLNHEDDGSGQCNTLIFGDIGGYKRVADGWIERFKPEEGGYFVRYADGYTSFSPAKAFEEGYSKI